MLTFGYLHIWKTIGETIGYGWYFWPLYNPTGAGLIERKNFKSTFPEAIGY